MKAIFLISNFCNYHKENGVKVANKCNNSNHFIDELRKVEKTFKSVALIASDPDNFKKSAEYAGLIVDALNLDGFKIENKNIIDHSFDGNIKDTVLASDLVILMGGHVPTQNKYFKEIGLKDILSKYDGVVIGQSAGSMNAAEMVYCQPESYEEFYDKNFQKSLIGLGLTKLKIMPHINNAKIDEIDGTTTMDMCLKDSYLYPHLGIVDSGFVEIKDGIDSVFGQAIYIKNGEIVSVCENGQNKILSNEFQK